MHKPMHSGISKFVAQAVLFKLVRWWWRRRRRSGAARDDGAGRDASADADRHARRTLATYFAYEENHGLGRAMQDWIVSRGETPPAIPPGGSGGLMLTQGRAVLDMSGSGAKMGAPEGASSAEPRAYGLGTGQIALGYMLVRTRALRIYPLVGVGGEGGGIEAVPASGAAESGRPEAGWGAAHLSGGLGVDLSLRIGPLRLLVGARFGVAADVFSIQQGPGEYVPPQQGPFFRVMAGLRFR